MNYFCAACGAPVEVVTWKHTYPCTMDGEIVGKESKESKKRACRCRPIAAEVRYLPVAKIEVPDPEDGLA